MLLLYIFILLAISHGGVCTETEKEDISHITNTAGINQQKINKINSHNIQDTTVPDSINKFAVDMSIEQSRNSAGNVLFSPISITVLLNLLMLGTAGKTSQELRTALNYGSQTESAIHKSYQSILENMNQNVKGVEVTMTNHLFVSHKMKLEDDFIADANRYYKADLQRANFGLDSKRLMDEVNKYVGKSTNGKITDLIKRPFSPRTRFVAVNTIYFNGLWETPFTKIYTSNATFHTKTSNIIIPFMVNVATVRFFGSDTGGYEIIALPYIGNRYSMYIITPTADRDVDRLEKRLNPESINAIIQQMSPQKIMYSIPRMQIRKNMNLKTDLQKLGINTLFNPSANFEKLTRTSNLFVDEMVHEAVLEITETGTVAAAASSASSNRNRIKTFHFDKPSLLFIRDDTNEIILFWSKVVEPTPLHT